ncbi:MAG: hypothetical protein HC933_22265 [Pleurocapsa sp. SU_196_0]|nr:hypothetical protein [Pleurocapsa sp. SU_196_0]
MNALITAFRSCVLMALTADPATLVPLLDFTKPMDYGHRNRPAEEVIAASLIRAVHAKASWPRS